MKILLVSSTDKHNTNGVDRFVEMLLHYLERRPDVEVVWLQLYGDPENLFVKMNLTSGCLRVRIPLPCQGNDFNVFQYWAKKYYRCVSEILKRELPDFVPDIVHINYLGPIHLALDLREQYSAKIVTHLHYLPWKVSLNSNEQRFNDCYQKMQAPRPNPAITDLYAAEGEKESYLLSDSVICVTECARDFVGYICPESRRKVTVIPNGISRICPPRENYVLKSAARLLFVGTVVKSKGLQSILDAMRLVQSRGYNLSITVAGLVSPRDEKDLKTRYPELSMDLLGRVPMERLKTCYQDCDIGIIASMQEQCSYAALEMMMAGMPIISTAVDGLDEIFTDEVDALKVRTVFSPVFGLCVDAEQMASQIIRLLDSQLLRESLGRSAYACYEREYRLDTMGERIVNLYHRIVEYGNES